MKKLLLFIAFTVLAAMNVQAAKFNKKQFVDTFSTGFMQGCLSEMSADADDAYKARFGKNCQCIANKVIPLVNSNKEANELADLTPKWKERMSKFARDCVLENN